MLLSVIIPVYNMEKYLKECLDKISKQQKNTEVEYLFVNDGSTDNSLKIIQDFKNEYENKLNITIIDQKNAGVGVARNVGVQHAQGKYLGFLDPDDLFSSKFVIDILNILKNYEVDIVQYEADRFFESIQDSRKITKQLRPDGLFSLDEALLKDFFEQSFWVCWTRVFKKSLFKDLKFPNIYMCEDIAVLPFVFQKAKTVYFHSQSLYYYRHNPNSITKSTNAGYLEKVESSYLYIYKLFLVESSKNMIFMHTLVPLLRGYMEFVLKHHGLKVAVQKWKLYKNKIDSLGFKASKLEKLTNRLFYQGGIYFLICLNFMKTVMARK